jgi:hypothetical protein
MPKSLHQAILDGANAIQSLAITTENCAMNVANQWPSWNEDDQI